ncbi:MAG TPA: EAL domain-containing protein [Burkholderiales bacterium]|nr:EAL domain-containing protein [Burkholderiales bacterium]
MKKSSPTIRVLLTEDVASDAELEVRELKRAGLRIAHRIVDSQQSFEAVLREFSPDIILSDFSMPQFDGMAALRLATELCPEVPFIFVSGTIGEEYAIRALKSGATDYVLKSNLVRLPTAVERALAEAHERREKRRAEIELDLTRERLTSIFTAIPDVLWSVDPRTGDVIYVSPAAKAVFGYEPQELLLDPELWKRQIHPADRDVVLNAWRRVHEGEGFDFDYRIVVPERGERWINARGKLVRGADGRPERIDGLARDISEQFEHRVRIARLSSVREFTSAINSALVRQREREELFATITRIAVDVGGLRGARVGLLDRESGNIAWRSWYAAWQGSPPQESGSGLAGQAVRTLAPAIANDLTRDAQVRAADEFVAAGVHALAAFPLLVDGRAAGALGLAAPDPGFFDDEQVRVLSELAANVSFALESMAKQERIAYLALYDPLTGLANRTLFNERLTQAVQAQRGAQAKLALIVTDLERFKAINDTLGTQAGDALLKAVADRLRRATPDVARVGSNVFALMFPNIGDAQSVARALETADVFGAPFDIAGHELRVSAKSGIAVAPDDGTDADAMFRNAEAALKRAKETGERYLFYAPSINARVAEQVQLEHRLRKAVERGEFALHYQPKLDLVSREIVGLEALLRWQGDDGTAVPPARFVPVLEQTGLIFEAGQQVLAAAKRQYAAWRAKGLAVPRIAVNVSAVQLRRKTFVQDVREALGSVGADGGGVDLEITESLLMSDVDESIGKLRELRNMGLRMALDDFGTGYSSLAYLSRLPVDTLKIDRSFVQDLTEHSDHTAIISAIISLAQALRLKVVAEGVETEQQAELLRLLRCDQAQGYLFSRPLPAQALERLLKPL